MASLNSALLLVLLVAISAFMAAPSGVEAQLVNPIANNVFNIGGTVLCQINQTFPGGVASPFPQAAVELRCRNFTVARTTTDESGRFNITLGPVDQLTQLSIQDFLQLGGCRVIVTTLLAQCNANLPVPGNLVANLTAGIFSIVNGINVFNFIAGVFSLVNNLGL
ncbi:hypothetical protein DCAR_0935449 [Daucus carota subsp. sativus]|uniref:Phylloplanin-like n=1 Tax=Daucus carota subsp. sativus TaxID=79200 RepID=A0AAF0XYS6_DAUCS|nr:PREDICTED: uncharacterized protein LOC108200788 [Daucus carota subsp. sativus]WOH15902.1 hypothetical protein DCAR_0935449 [Daucus carota subsp. sativus]